MPAVIFFACLDLEQKSSFMDGHYLKFALTFFGLYLGLHHFNLSILPHAQVVLEIFTQLRCIEKNQRDLPNLLI
jgi:hypothetical protein